MSIVHWFRRDLRLADNSALRAAILDSGGEVLPVFVFDLELLAGSDIATARVQFMQDCLFKLDQSLRAHGSQLILLRGNVVEALSEWVRANEVTALYFNRDYTPAARRRDQAVSRALQDIGCRVESFKDSVLHEEDEVLTKDGKPYTVFTPYKRAWLALPIPKPLQDPSLLFKPAAIKTTAHTLSALPLESTSGVEARQSVPAGGEVVAHNLLDEFITSGQLSDYHRQRDFPALDSTSHLSPHLRFGTISARQCYWRAETANAGGERPHGRQSAARGTAEKTSAEPWISELIWREFYTQVLFHFPHANHANFNRRYDKLQWGSDDPDLDRARFEAWCNGRTGYPIVDAAMCQLNQTAWMHNRARMIVASFLTRDLLLDWRWGESYFMQKLVDGDPASNNGGWQWAAGTGTDAQPYFRIFNPVLQSQRFDPQGNYLRQFLPELSRVPAEYIHEPWKMSSEQQRQHECVIGKDYLSPIVVHASQKELILRRFREIRS